jgi:DNA replication protein DnaC
VPAAYERPLPTMIEYDRCFPCIGGAGMSLQPQASLRTARRCGCHPIGAQFASLAEEAGQRNHSHLHYLEALLQAEMEDRERRSIELRMKEAHLPRIKTLEEFDFAQSPHIPAARIRALAEGGYLERAEPVLLVGDPGTGKSHLATGLAIAACRQRKRVRFTTAAALVNQLVEAQREQSLSRMLARWSAWN